METVVLPFWWGGKKEGEERGPLGTQKVGRWTAFKSITKGPGETSDQNALV